MHRNLKVALGGAALTAGIVVGLPNAAMAIDCTNAEIAALYPDVCVTTQPIRDNVGAPGSGSVGGGAVGGGASGGSTSGGSVSSGRGAVGALPFTGDELLVMSLAGAAALAAGTAMTVAGRRRGAATA